MGVLGNHSIFTLCSDLRYIVEVDWDADDEMIYEEFSYCVRGWLAIINAYCTIALFVCAGHQCIKPTLIVFL